MVDIFFIILAVGIVVWTVWFNFLRKKKANNSNSCSCSSDCGGCAKKCSSTQQ